MGVMASFRALNRRKRLIIAAAPGIMTAFFTVTFLFITPSVAAQSADTVQSGPHDQMGKYSSTPDYNQSGKPGVDSLYSDFWVITPANGPGLLKSAKQTRKAKDSLPQAEQRERVLWLILVGLSISLCGLANSRRAVPAKI